MLIPIGSLTSITPDVLDRQSAQQLYSRHTVCPTHAMGGPEETWGRARPVGEPRCLGFMTGFPCRRHSALEWQRLDLGWLGAAETAVKQTAADRTREAKRMVRCGAVLYEYVCWMSETRV